MRSAASISELKAGIDLAAIVEAEGVELRTAGAGRLRGLCPFHSERTPSFFVFRDKGRWFCFGGCGGGDAIDFVRRVRGCSFPEALAFLGIESPQRSAGDMVRLKAERRQREDARWRERELAWTLGKAIRLSYAAIRRITPDTLDRFAPILQELPTIENQHQILIDGNAEDKSAVMADWAGIRLFSRGLLFNRNFDFARWCGTIFNRGCHVPEHEPRGCGKQISRN